MTESDLQKKYADLLKKHGTLLCTDDGQAFYNTAEGKVHASNHAATKGSKVILVKAKKNKKNGTK